MECTDIKVGLKVRTGFLGETTGLTVNSKHLHCRKFDITGSILSYVPGHGGEVRYVQHDNEDDIGAYCNTEFEPL